MSLINIKNLSFNYDGCAENIFENVNLALDTSWRLGLIGRNGRGKTTLLKLLAGEYEYCGQITADTDFEYYPYDIPNENETVFNVIHRICKAQEWEAARELSMLDMPENILERTFSTLSNGEKTKVTLAALFLHENAFLLIDEPTNHLDENARKVVARYLKRKNGFILVSHDRTLLDNCTDHILSINRKSIGLEQGNFTSWEQNRAAMEIFETTQNEKLTREIDRLRESAKKSAKASDGIEKTKKGSKNSGLRPDRGYIGHKSAKMMQRAKNAQKRCENAIEKKSQLLHDVDRSESLKLSPLFLNGSVAELRDVCVIYGGRTINKPLSLKIESGQRIALRGKNGCGKTSILKLLVGQNIERTGNIFMKSSISISYAAQDTSFLNGSLSKFSAELKIDDSKFKTILRKLGFERHMFETDMKSFSQGQKKKVLIASSLCQSAHLYVWDEPLNFIDIMSRLQIEELLTEYAPTMLFVEHDSAFVGKIATDIIEM